MGADTPDPNWTYRIPRARQYQYPGSSAGALYASVDDDLESVVFLSTADILGLGTPANVYQVYRWERRTDETVLVSVNNEGDQSSTTNFRTPHYGSRSSWFIGDGGNAVLFVGAPCDWTDPCVEERNGQLVHLNCLCPDPDGECAQNCQGVEQVYYRNLFVPHT